jgi:hypothetical protein
MKKNIEDSRALLARRYAISDLYKTRQGRGLLVTIHSMKKDKVDYTQFEQRQIHDI